MPVVSFSTNVQLDSEDAKKAFIPGFSKFCAKTLDKDEKNISIEVSFDPYLMYGGTFEPAIRLHVMYLGNINPTNSQLWSREFSSFFEQKLGVPASRGYVIFTDPGADFVGWNGTTVAAARAAMAHQTEHVPTGR